MSTRSVVTEFARQFYDERDVVGAFSRFVAPDYLQHNPGIADGRDAAIAALAGTWSSPDLRLAVTLHPGGRGHRGAVDRRSVRCRYSLRGG